MKKTISEREMATQEVLAAEAQISEVINKHPDIVADSPFLVVRTGLLAKLFFLQDVYQQIVGVPGDFIELGSWYGQTSVILENLRAIYEPFNLTRKIISVDTFSGYPESSGLNINSNEIEKYNAGEGWLDVLGALQSAHSNINSRAFRSDFTNIKGDILTDAFWENEEVSSNIALCYFDIATYETTKSMLSNILPRMVKSGIIVIDDFGIAYEGVLRALQEENIFQRFDVVQSKIYPSKLYFRT